MSSPRREAGRALWQLADLTRAHGSGRATFRARAYREAVWSLDLLPPGLDVPAAELRAVPGIGAGITALLEEWRQTGRIASLDRLREEYPAEAALMRRLPRARPATLRAVKTLGIERFRDLGHLLDGDTVALPGVGTQTADLWRSIIALWPEEPARPIGDVAGHVARLAAHLEGLAPRIGGTTVAGDVADRQEWIDRIDLQAQDPDAAAAAFSGSALRPPGEAAVTHLGLPVRFAPADPSGRRRGLRLRGDLHVHTDWSPDGRQTLEAVLDGAARRGYEYVAVTDHTVGLRFGGLDAAGLGRQAEAIAAARAAHPEIRVLHGAEVNVLPDGTLDLDDATLARLDVVVAGVHSMFHLSRPAQTERVVRAVRHPAVDVLAHPTGRRIGIRPPLDLDFEAVVAAAVAAGTALELNGHLDRLDLGRDLARLAAEAGALFAVDGDAHRPEEMDNVANGLATARAAGVAPERIVNSWPWEEIAAWLGSGDDRRAQRSM